MVLYTAAIHALSNSQSFGFKLGTTEGFEIFFSGVKISGKCIVKPTGPMLCQYC